MNKFSIREMLAFATLFALGMLVWRTREEAKRNEVRVAELQGDVAILKDQLWVKRSAVHQAMLNTRDEFASLRDLRERSLKQFDVLHEKYSVIEPRAPNVLSIRGVPTIQIDAGSSSVAYRLSIPRDRPVWLKYGVHLLEPRINRSRLDQADLLSESPILVSGPFEMKLTAGVHMLVIATEPASKGALPIVIRLDDQVILRTSYLHQDVSGSSRISVSAPAQIDYAPDRPLPWLATPRISLRKDNTGPSTKVHGFSVWLSDRPSEFETFPNR